ncbi:MAG TPA: CHAT domain-containing tetratricopeptide repeat protein [Candidatus Polarisedimenticolaceae bacterium]|nr:CHAT domain-containing tetratricopeptide repeat protein [Candidatus Polarisedimenticolaceae bacterium]
MTFTWLADPPGVWTLEIKDGPDTPSRAVGATSAYAASPRDQACWEAAQLTDRIRSALKDGNETALQMLQDAEASARRCFPDDAPSIARFIDHLGLLLYNSEKPEFRATTLEVLRHGLEEWEKLRPLDHASVADSLDNLSSICFNWNRFDEALKYGQRSLEHRKLQPETERDAAMGATLEGIAQILGAMGRYDEARPIVTDRQRYLQSSDASPTDKAVGYLTSGELTRLTDGSVPARAEFNKGLAIAPKHTPVHAWLLNSVAGTFRDEGSYADAERYEIESFSERQALKDQEGILTATFNLAELARFQGRRADAEAKYRACAEEARSLYVAPDSTDPKLSVYLAQLAIFLAEDSQYVEAETLLREALSIRETGLGKEHSETARALHDLATVLIDEGQPRDALPLLRRALEIRTAIAPKSVDVAESLIEVSRAQLAIRQLPEALKTIDDALAKVNLHSEWREAAAKAQFEKSDVLWAAHEREESLVVLSAALGSVESMRQESSAADTTRATFLARYAPRFDTMVTRQIAAGHPNEALRWAERTRARTLVEEVAFSKTQLSDPSTGVAQDLVDRRRVAEATLRKAQAFERSLMERALAGDLQAEHDSDDAAHAVAIALSEYRRANGEIRRVDPRYREVMASIDHLTSNTDELRQAMKAFANDILYFQIGVEASRVFVVSAQGAEVQAFSLNLDESTAKLLGVSSGPLTSKSLGRLFDCRFRAKYDVPSPRGARLASSCEGNGFPNDQWLHALWRALVPEPVWARIHKAGHVTVIPDAQLNQVPMDALVVTVDSTEESTKYWLDDGPVITIAPSISFSFYGKETHGTTDLELLSVAGVVNRIANVGGSSPGPPTDVNGARGVDGERDGTLEQAFRLPALSNSIPEQESIAAAIQRRQPGCRLVLLHDDTATEQEVRADIGRARLVHFATHAIGSTGSDGLRAALVLKLPAGTVASEADGLLELHEVYSLRIPAELVVLAACGTHTGEEINLEGAVSLSRGFLIAGARRVVSTLWAVDDSAARQVITALFDSVPTGDRPTTSTGFADALWEAKRKVRATANYHSPQFWGAFVLIGSP